MNPSPQQGIPGACSMLRRALLVIAAGAMAFLALWEVGLAYPVAGWVYLMAAIVFAAALLQPVSLRRQAGRVGVMAAVIAVMAGLYFVEWTTRKPFLRDLARIRVGMTEAEVRAILGRYIEGTGWVAPPGDGRAEAPGTLRLAGSASEYSTTNSAGGQMAIRGSLVFRHSNDGAFNSDWGIVAISSGRVTRVEFSPD